MGEGASVTMPYGIVCVGGCKGADGTTLTAHVFLMRWDGAKVVYEIASTEKSVGRTGAVCNAPGRVCGCLQRAGLDEGCLQRAWMYGRLFATRPTLEQFSKNLKKKMRYLTQDTASVVYYLLPKLKE